MYACLDSKSVANSNGGEIPTRHLFLLLPLSACLSKYGKSPGIDERDSSHVFEHHQYGAIHLLHLLSGKGVFKLFKSRLC